MSDASPKTEKKPQSEDGTSSTLVIRNLPSSITSSEFSDWCSNIAPIQHAFVVTKKTEEGVQCEGYGFVTFRNKPDAVKLVENKDLKYKDTTLSITYAKPRHRKQIEEGTKQKRVQPSKDPSLPTLRPRLIFRNLSWKVRNPEQIEKVVRVYGKPKEVRIPRAAHGRMMGFAFVEMKTRKAAGKVVENVNGMEIEGRQVAVDWCVSKDDWKQVQTPTAREEKLEETEEVEEEEDVKSEEGEDDGTDDENIVSEKEDDDEEELPEPTSQTIFVRNIPFLVTRSTLFNLFRPLGHIASLYLVTDPTTGLSRGTAFLTFSSAEAAQSLLDLDSRIKSKTATPEEIEKYTLEGRTLDFLSAVNREEANRLKDEHATKKRDDKRNLYLLNEGTINADHPLYSSLSNMDLSLRRDSLKQRKDMLASNPSLHLSLTRLAIRNIPRSMEDKEFKSLAIKAIKEFDDEVKKELREGLTEEEIARDKEEVRGKPVRQAKIVLEKTGRSKGYGFIQYNSHVNALKGLRWLNARVVGERKVDGESDRKRRLLVEFAIENVQVVKRRKEREEASRRKAAAAKEALKNKSKAKVEMSAPVTKSDGKRKRNEKEDGSNKKQKTEKVAESDVGKIIAAKRFRKKLERGKKGK